MDLLFRIFERSNEMMGRRYFQLRGNFVGRTASFRITDLQGRVMRTFESATPGATHIVPVWDWAAGVYFLQYVEDGVPKATGRFVVVE